MIFKIWLWHQYLGLLLDKELVGLDKLDQESVTGVVVSYLHMFNEHVSLMKYDFLP